MVLDPQTYVIVEASDAFLRQTMRQRADIVGRVMFEAFPDDDCDPDADGTRNLVASLERAKATGSQDIMALQFHPILCPASGKLEERYWSAVNYPIFDEQGTLLYLVHRTEDVTAFIMTQRELVDKTQGLAYHKSQLARKEAEVVAHSHRLKLLNDELETSRAHFHAIFRDAPVGIALTDLQGRFTEANEAYCQLLGYSLEELRELDVLVITEAEDRQSNMEQITLLKEGKIKRFVLEKRYLSKTGKAIWCRVTGSPMRGAGGNVVGLIGVAEDISRQKLTESKLRQTEALASLGRRIARVGGWVVTTHPTREVKWSEEIFDILECQGESVPPLPEVLALMDPEQGGKDFALAMERCWNHGEPFEIEVKMKSFTGRELWIRQAAHPELDQNGKVINVVGAFQDITRQKQEEVSRQELADRLGTVLENMRDAFILLDEEWRYVYMNRECERIFGIDRKEVIGRVCTEVYPSLTSTPLYQAMREASSENKSVHVEYFSDWFQHWIEANTYPTPSGLVVNFRTTTDKHDLEEQLRQSQRMDSLGQLTGGVAHDFNNLLTVIQGNAELLQEQLLWEPALLNLAEMISKAAQRGADLTQRLLAFARRQALEPTVVDINQMVINLHGLLQRTLGEHIQISLVLAPDLWLAMIDSNQLESSLLNLGINARDAMPEGGKLTIETGNLEVDADNAAPLDQLKPGRYVMLTVSDTGSGIPGAILDKVVEPFFTTKPKGKGTGLGLSMVFGFAKQSGGHLSIYSETGEGTTIKMYLPAATALEQENMAPPSGERHLQRGGETILLVEDDPLVRRYAQDQLISLGYQVLVAENGMQAWNLLQQVEAVDLLFTDVIMPGGMGGRELAEKAQNLRPGLQVLYTSGYTENAIVHNGRLEPGVHLLSKPYQRAMLARKVREALDNQRFTKGDKA